MPHLRPASLKLLTIVALGAWLSGLAVAQNVVVSPANSGLPSWQWPEADRTINGEVAAPPFTSLSPRRGTASSTFRPLGTELRQPGGMPIVSQAESSDPIQRASRWSTPIARTGRGGSVDLPRVANHGGIAKLASTSSYDRRSTSPRNGLGDTRLVDVTKTLPYGDRLIRSARQGAADFRQIAESTSGVASALASENADFADQWAQLAASFDKLSARVDEAVAKREATQRDLGETEAKLAQYGLTPTVGMLLRHKRDQLDAWQVNDSQTLFSSQEVRRSRQEQLQLELVKFDGSEAETQTREVLIAAGIDPEGPENAAVRRQVYELLAQRFRWIDSLHQIYHDYQEKLGELDATTISSAKLTANYRKLIARQITWIRSGEPVGLRDLWNLDGGIAALFDARRSGDFGPTLERKLSANSVAGFGLLVFIILALSVRWRGKAWLVAIGRKKRMSEASAELRKVVASVLTIVVASTIPSILYAVSRWLGTGVVSEATLHASSAFAAASLVALLMEIPRQLLRNDGFLDKHVDVQLPGRKRANRYLMLISVAVVVAAYAVTLMGLIDHGMWRGSVSRFGFMLTMLLVAWSAHRWLRPAGGFLQPLIARFGGPVLHQLRLVIYLAGIAFPLGMLVLSAAGYGFTATELIKRAMMTLVGLLICATLWPSVKIIAASLWKLLTAPGSSMRRDEKQEALAGDDGDSSADGLLADHFLELKHQIAFLCQCSLVMVGIVCVGWLWMDVLPDVRVGNPVVWTVEDTVVTSSVDDAGQVVASSQQKLTPITAMHLLLAAATMFIAFQLARLLPALWDALVLQRVSFDEGMEHVTLVLGRVLLFGVGCLIACHWVGLRWQTIQWLAVGLTVGLGFGLQDMVRNVFGGLIVLFEKPARLGDLITVGKMTGRVATQKLRTTVLSDDDGREVIVPNKKFVSEDVVNWMGAGRLNVIPIEVAVTRDERPADLCRTLQELVLQQSDVLLSPAPQATLVCVGKSFQRIEVRAWIEDSESMTIFRDALLKTVRRYLRSKDLLAPAQPTQPKLQDIAADSIRRRSA